MKHFFAAWLLVFVTQVIAAPPDRPADPLLEERFDGPAPSSATLEGDAAAIDFGTLDGDMVGSCVALDSGKDVNKDGQRAGAVKFRVKNLQGNEGKWFRFSFRGLPARDFDVRQDADLAMRVRYFGENGAKPLDGVVREFYKEIKSDRKDIDGNGVAFKNGAVAWTQYALDFRLPFNDIDTVELSVAYQNGTGRPPYGSFFVDEVRLEKISTPEGIETPVAAPKVVLETKNLVPLGGRWFYLRSESDKSEIPPKSFNTDNFDRLIYKCGDVLETPFAQNRGTWLRKGFKDRAGNVMTADKWMDDPVTVEILPDTLEIHSNDIPNHPTGKFPGYLGNPSYIQEQQILAVLPLNPKPNPTAKSMTLKNANRALPMGPTGVAVNGVVFFNPFDAQMDEAVNLMDRCCGHPNPDNEYHYHKYPVCVRSPFEDKGAAHSPLIGWAFDGFPVYGPYEGDGVMAMNSKLNPLNAFNVHTDKDRGWHYHVTPGKFPYIIGGYWGAFDRRNSRNAMHGGGMGGPRPGFPPGFGPGPGYPPPEGTGPPPE